MKRKPALKLTKEHMSMDKDANSSEEEGGWVSGPPQIPRPITEYLL